MRLALSRRLLAQALSADSGEVLHAHGNLIHVLVAEAGVLHGTEESCVCVVEERDDCVHGRHPPPNYGFLECVLARARGVVIAPSELLHVSRPVCRGGLDAGAVHALGKVAAYLNQVLWAEEALAVAVVAAESQILALLGTNGAGFKRQSKFLFFRAPDVRGAPVVAQNELYAASIYIIDSTVCLLDQSILKTALLSR